MELPSGGRILPLVQRQVSLGPRVPGSAAHDELARFLAAELVRHDAVVQVQEFPARFGGRTVACRNVVGHFRSRLSQASGQPAVLLGTHYDTRPRADRERDPVLRSRPIPGANDGGSGTAVFLDLLAWLAAGEARRDVVVAFLDAEDLGDIDGNAFSLGAEHLAANPPPDLGMPAEVLVLDMVGGRDMVLDLDAHALAHPASRRLVSEVFRTGVGLGLAPFCREKPHRVKWIVSDQWPFLRRGVASCLLIDIDYPAWHTQADLPGALSEHSLAAIAAAVRSWLSPPRSEDRRGSRGCGGP